MKAVDGTVTHVGEGGKVVVVKAADGTEHTFDVVGHDTAAAAEDIGKGTDKGRQSTRSTTPKTPAKRSPTSSKNSSALRSGVLGKIARRADNARKVKENWPHASCSSLRTGSGIRCSHEPARS